MNDYEAISILGLGSSFTGEEELAAYRELVKKYHPDNYDNASEEEIKFAHEKMIKVNAAHEYLKKKYFPNPSDMNKRVNIASYSSYSSTYNNSSSGFNSNNKNKYNKESSSGTIAYRNKKIEEINKYIEGLADYRFPTYIAKVMAKIIDCARKYTLFILRDLIKEDIDRDFKTFKIILESSYYFEILHDYAKNNNIDLKYFEHKIDFNCNAIEFYEQLEKLKKEYETHNNNKNSDDLNIYKRRKIAEIRENGRGILTYKFPDYIDKIVNDISKMSLEKIDEIYSAKTKDSIDEIYSRYKIGLTVLYGLMRNGYAKFNNLDISYFYNINNECSIVEFYEQLEKIKKQYESDNRLKRLQDRFNKETEKYKNYIGYWQLKDFISRTIEKVITAIGKDDYVIETCIENMHTIITNKFEEYFKEMLTKYAEKYKDYAGYNEFVKIRIPSKIDLYTSYAKERNFAETQLEDFIKKFHDEIENVFARNFAIIDKLNKIKKSFDDLPDHLELDSFYSLTKELNTAEQKFNIGDDITHYLDEIETKLEKLLLLNKDRELLNKAYNVLVSNYHNKLTSMNPIDYKGVQRVNEIFDAAIKIFAKLENQEIDIDRAVQLLTSITFNNYDEDMSLINSTNKINIASGVYIIKPEYMRDTYADESFFYLKEEDGNYYMYRTGTTTTKEMMPIDKIKNKFISLEDFLQKAEYIGKEYQPLVSLKTLIVYKLEKVCITINENSTMFTINQNINNELNVPSDYSIYGGDYKDINELINAIKKRVEDSVLSYENREKTRAEKAKKEFSGFRPRY